MWGEKPKCGHDISPRGCSTIVRVASGTYDLICGCRNGVGGGRYPFDTKNVGSIMSSPHEGTQANIEAGFDFSITTNTKTLGGSDQGLGQALERKWFRLPQ